MELSQLEKQRTTLLQLMLLLVIISLGVITYIAFLKGDLYVTPSLTIASLIACLFVIAKERTLKGLHGQLIEEIIQKERQVKNLNTELKGEQKHLKQEKEKTDQLDIRLKEITALYRAINTVNSVQAPQRTLDTVLRAALDLVECECGSIMLLDDRKETMILIASQGLSNRVAKHSHQRSGEGVAGWVAQNRQSLILKDDVKDDQRFSHVVDRGNDKAYSAMCLPLEIRGNVIGVINFTIPSNHPTKQFVDQDLRIAGIFAQHAAVSIENTQLIATVQKMKKSLQPT